MRNDTVRWDPPAPLTLRSDALTIAEVALPGQTCVSGVDVLARYPHALGWPDVATGADYALSLRRDRVLLVGAHALTVGYDADTGLAVTDVSDGDSVLDMTGAAAFATLQRGAELRRDQPSRSVTRALFGIPVHLYRHDAAFRLHVPRGFAQALFAHLTGNA